MVGCKMGIYDIEVMKVISAGCYSFKEGMDFASYILSQESALLFIYTLLAPLHIQSHIAEEAIC